MIRQVEKIRAVVLERSVVYDVDPKLFACLILHESAGDAWAIRYENAFFNNYLATKKREDLAGHVPLEMPTLATEKRARAISWGLCQTLGDTARVVGFAEDYLSELCQIEPNIECGLKYFAKCLQKAGGSELWALQRWNGGGNPDYGKRVLGRRDRGEYSLILGNPN